MPGPEMAADLRRYWPRVLRILLLSAVFVMPVMIMRGKSAISDEVAHLPAGYSYLATRIFKINPQHPPFIKELSAIPLLFLGAKMPVDRETLETSVLPLPYQWDFGKAFLFSQNAERLLFWGRVPVVLLSVGLAVLVTLWAGRLWGTAAGLLGLVLYAFDPTITAHAQLVTTDIGVAFFATLFLYLLRRHLAAPSWQRLVLSGVALGLALAAKFSALFLIPVAAVLVGLAAWRGREDDRRGERRIEWPAGKRKGSDAETATVIHPSRGDNASTRLLFATGTVGLLVLLASVVVWAIYFFPSDLRFYVNGVQTVNQDHHPEYPYYLMGRLKEKGWVHYLLIAWLVKTPLASLLLLAAAVLAFFVGKRAPWLDEAFLVVPALAFFIGYSLTADNIGVRYLIPCFPFFFIFTARLGAVLGSIRRWGRGALALLLGWYLVEFAAIWPDHLSYFNQVAGGPRHGVEWLDDSNVDWGQGLIQLRRYLADRRVGDYRFCYFGSADPGYYGIRGERVTPKGLGPYLPAPGTLIVSAHCVARGQALLATVHGRGPNNWLLHTAPKAIVGHAYYVYEIP